ncbi:MAG: hypothetical protein WHT64_08800 [Desulfomicrobiaceae bacterium]
MFFIFFQDVILRAGVQARMQVGPHVSFLCRCDARGLLGTASGRFLRLENQTVSGTGNSTVSCKPVTVSRLQKTRIMALPNHLVRMSVFFFRRSRKDTAKGVMAYFSVF